MGVQILTAQPCSDCGSSDALTIYDWGTKCFSCDKATFKPSEESLKVINSKKAFSLVQGEFKTITDRKLSRLTCEFYGTITADNHYHFPYSDECLANAWRCQYLPCGLGTQWGRECVKRL
jgi:twinkle protein